FVEAYVNRHPRLAAIDRAVESEGARLVFLLRLSPIVPFVFLNYVLGVSRIKFRDYILGTFGMVPAVAAYVYAGKVAGDLATVAAGVATPRGPTYYALLTVGLAATILASVSITRAAARAVETRANPHLVEEQRPFN
ncbi:MAG: TVP38/TMEM64 family protein, partial [Vicinamibacterales bacterium]